MGIIRSWKLGNSDFLVLLHFELGIYPNSLKLANVIPIVKAGSKLEVINYKPISLLPTLSKTIDKLCIKVIFISRNT